LGKRQHFDVDLHLANPGIVPVGERRRRHFGVAGVVVIQQAQPEFSTGAGLAVDIHIRRQESAKYLGARRDPALGEIVRNRWRGRIHDGCQRNEDKHRFPAAVYKVFGNQTNHRLKIV
jgi:hypothetical protein